MAEPASEHVLVVGTVAYDTIETPFAEVDKALGGSATYFSSAASLFTQTHLVSVVGGDFEMGELAFLRDRDVDLSGIEVVDDGRTFHWSGEYHYDMNTRTTHATDLNVLEDFQPDVPDEAREAGLVFLANVDPELQLDVLDQLEADPFVAADTMNFWIEGKPEKLKDVLARVDALLINDEEAREMTDTPHLTEAMRRIQGLGPDIVVVKKGEHGCVLANGSDWFSAPAFLHADVTDPTGAGDAFAGGFLGTLAAEPDIDDDALRKATVYGTASASLVIEDFGPSSLEAASRDMLEKRAKRLEEFAQFPDI
jgi:sugar/nucleoside kinase (ribokinase family)